MKCIKQPSACSADMEWRQIPDFSSYWVSEYGDVVSSKGGSRKLKGCINYDGYLCYGLHSDDGRKKTISAHRLVALSFLGKPPSQTSQVRHLNGSRIYCHYTNLKWGEPMENRLDTIKHGTSATRGEKNPKAKLTDKDVISIRSAHRQIKEGTLKMTVQSLADKYGLHIATVSDIAARRTWRHVP